LSLRGSEATAAISQSETDFESLRDRLNVESGRRPAAPFFLLLAQKKEGKEKGTLRVRCASRQ
jgi:hypothetical protein